MYRMPFIALAETRVQPPVQMLHTIVAPAESEWRTFDELESQAVDSHQTYLHPGGPDPDPSLSNSDRVVQILTELGWEAREPADVGTPFAVRRAAHFTVTQVETLDGEQHALVTNLEGDPVAKVRIKTTLAVDVAAAGWTLGRQAPGWPDHVREVSPADWSAVLRTSTHQRLSAKSQAHDATERWATVIREAMLAGIDARSLADLGGVTVQRIYQIRDRRR